MSSAAAALIAQLIALLTALVAQLNQDNQGTGGVSVTAFGPQLAALQQSLTSFQKAIGFVSAVNQYILIQFTEGLQEQAYQQIDPLGNLTYWDTLGNPLDLPAVTESQVINANPPFPPWGT